MRLGSIRSPETVEERQARDDLQRAREIREARISAARTHPNWLEATDVRKHGQFYVAADEPGVLLRSFSGAVWDRGASPLEYVPELRFVVGSDDSLVFYEAIGRRRS